MTTLQTIPSNKVWTSKTVLYQDASDSHYDFTANAFYQDIVLFGLPPNYIVSGVKITLITEFVNGSTPESETLLYVASAGNLISPAQENGAGQAKDSLLNSMNLSPSIVNGPTLPNTPYWFSVTGLGSFSVNGGVCAPSNFAAQDIVARFFSVSSGSTHFEVSGIQQGMVEISVQFVSI